MIPILYAKQFVTTYKVDTLVNLRKNCRKLQARLVAQNSAVWTVAAFSRTRKEMNTCP